MTVKKEIQNFKERLKRKTEINGLWENFGQEEVSTLESKYRDHQYLNDGVWKQIENFNKWCMNYTVS